MGAAARRWLAALLALVCSACAGLPKDVERPVSTAFDAAGQPTALSALAQQRRQAAGTRTASGFMLLSGPQEAYGSRLALAQSAEKTLDLQYYTIHADESSARLLREVVAAARRGVRVRILLDDFHSTGRNALIMRLAFEPHIEMRMFNPVSGPRDSMLGRLWGSLTDFSRVQQRMHNKLFLADNVMGVTGGRNLGDAYFGQGQANNFVDLDVLAAGPIVADMSRSFDSYWNNPRAYPVQSLITKEELERLREQLAQDSNEAPAAQDPAKAAPPQLLLPPGNTKDGGETADRQRGNWDEQPLDLRQARFVWAPAVMLADKPAKIALSADTGADQEASDEEGTGDEEGDTVVDGLLTLMQHTRQELLIISPYFVPGQDMKRAFADACARGVRVRILTNSLSSNDAPIAHVGYARHRQELLEMGVELYELRSEQAGLRSAFGSSATGSSGAAMRSGSRGNAGNAGLSGGATGASRSMLHSKVMVVDRRLIVVGSMNLDLRSQLQNTEIALLVRSKMLSEQAARQIDDAMRQGAWHVQLQEGGSLVWRAPQGSDLPDMHHDPDTSAGLRLMLRLLGPLAPDRLL